MLVDFEEVVGSNNNTHSCFGHGPLSSVCSARSGLFSSFTTLAFLCVLNSKVVPYYPTPVFVIGVLCICYRSTHYLITLPSRQLLGYSLASTTSSLETSQLFLIPFLPIDLVHSLSLPKHSVYSPHRYSAPQPTNSQCANTYDVFGINVETKKVGCLQSLSPCSV